MEINMDRNYIMSLIKFKKQSLDLRKSEIELLNLEINILWNVFNSDISKLSYEDKSHITEIINNLLMSD